MNFFNSIISRSNRAADKINAAAKTLISDKVIVSSIDRLHFDEVYRAVFKQEEEKVRRIAEDMKANGFDKSQPIVIDENFAILDGNSRYMAAKEAGIKKVPVIIKRFETKKEALLYEINLQMNRRNIKDASVLIETYSTIASMKDEKGKKLFTDAEIAEKLGVSPRQISKAKEVDSKADAGIKESLAKGEISLNQAYGSLKKTGRNDEKKAEVSAAEAEKVRKNPAGVKTENAEPSAGRTSKPDENSAGKKAFKNLNLKFRPEDFSLLKSAARKADAAVEEYAVKVLLEKARPF